MIGLGLFLSAISMIVMPFSYGSYLSGMFKETFANNIIFFYYNRYKSYPMMEMASWKLYSKIQKVIWPMYGAWNRVRFSGRWGLIINGHTGGHQTHSSVWNCICRKSDWTWPCNLNWPCNRMKERRFHLKLHDSWTFELNRILDIGYGIVRRFCFGPIDWRCYYWSS